MKQQMPNELNGRMVNLDTIEDEVRPACAAADVWASIESNTTPGIWYRLRATMDMTVKDLARVHSSARLRAFMAGMDADTLIIMVRERDGICFQWQGGVHTDKHQTLIMKRWRKRLDKKMRDNLKSRERRNARMKEYFQTEDEKVYFFEPLEKEISVEEVKDGKD